MSDIQRYKCKKLQHINYVSNVQAAINCIQLIEEGCQTNNAVRYSTQKSCLFDNTKELFGPSKKRNLKLIRSVDQKWGYQIEQPRFHISGKQKYDLRYLDEQKEKDFYDINNQNILEKEQKQQKEEMSKSKSKQKILNLQKYQGVQLLRKVKKINKSLINEAKFFDSYVDFKGVKLHELAQQQQEFQESHKDKSKLIQKINLFDLYQGEDIYNHNLKIQKINTQDIIQRLSKCQALPFVKSFDLNKIDAQFNDQQTQEGTNQNLNEIDPNNRDQNQLLIDIIHNAEFNIEKRRDNDFIHDKQTMVKNRIEKQNENKPQRQNQIFQFDRQTKYNIMNIFNNEKNKLFKDKQKESIFSKTSKNSKSIFNNTQEQEILNNLKPKEQQCTTINSNSLNALKNNIKEYQTRVQKKIGFSLSDPSQRYFESERKDSKKIRSSEYFFIQKQQQQIREKNKSTRQSLQPKVEQTLSRQNWQQKKKELYNSNRASQQYIS